MHTWVALLENQSGKTMKLFTVMRRQHEADGGKVTDILDFYAELQHFDGGGKVFGREKIVHQYIDNEWQLKEFENFSGLKLSDIPIFDSDRAFRKTKLPRHKLEIDVEKPFSLRVYSWPKKSPDDKPKKHLLKYFVPLDFKDKKPVSRPETTTLNEKLKRVQCQTADRKYLSMAPEMPELTGSIASQWLRVRQSAASKSVNLGHYTTQALASERFVQLLDEDRTQTAKDVWQRFWIECFKLAAVKAAMKPEYRYADGSTVDDPHIEAFDWFKETFSEKPENITELLTACLKSS